MKFEYFDTTIGEQLTLQRGFDISKKEQLPGAVPVVSSGGIASYHNEAKVTGPGVITGRKGSLGTVFYVEEDYWPHSTALWVKDFKGNNPRFIYYFFKNMADELKRMDVGAANPSLNRNHVHPLPALWPTNDTQDYIVKDLGSLDDKIELNRQMNATLEEISRSLFKRWFVDFEFPYDFKNGRPDSNGQPYKSSGGKMVDSELGPIPEGWEATAFGQVAECLDRKRVPLSKRQREERQGGYPYHGATSVMDYVDDYIFDGVYLLLGEDGSVLKDDGTPFIQYVWGKFWVNNHAHVLCGKNGVSTEQLMLFIQMQNIAAYVTGAVQLKLNQKNMNSIPFVKAGELVNQEFNQALPPLFSKMRQISEEIDRLSELRDTLLPKLLSGELDVLEVEGAEHA